MAKQDNNTWTSFPSCASVCVTVSVYRKCPAKCVCASANKAEIKILPGRDQ